MVDLTSGLWVVLHAKWHSKLSAPTFYKALNHLLHELSRVVSSVVSILWFIPPSTVPKRHPINNSLMWTVCIYIYIYIYAFSRCFYPKRLTVHSGYTCFVSMCVPWELNPQPFALLTQCSTTEPQGHLHVTDSILKDCLCYQHVNLL